MDVPAFVLNESLRIFQKAGIQVLFPASLPIAQEGPEHPYWETVLARLPHAPKAIITYPELGEDFSPKPDPMRSNIFRTILQALALPKGTFAFLPYTFNDNTTETSDESHFLDLIVRLSPDYLFVFGQTPEFYTSAASLLVNSPKVLEFPSLSEIMGQGDELYQQILSTLRSCFRSATADHS